MAATWLGLCAACATPVMAQTTGRTEKAWFIQEYRVEGAKKLPRLAVEEAVYPFLGPDRTAEDVELARASLEKAYADAGYQTVGVQIPEQTPGGVVRLLVIERPIGRLRVRDARYSQPSRLKEMAPSVAEGKVLNFNELTQDVMALNRLSERQVTPSLQAGVAPDTVDVELTVKENAPFHASAEVNNRRSADTTDLRVNASVSATNLWQRGHALNFSYQTSPQNTSEVKVFSGYYLARFEQPDWFALMVQASKQDSNVSTLGSAAVLGRGETAGVRAMITLPGPATTADGRGFVHSAHVGADFKNFDQLLQLGEPQPDGSTEIYTPIAYVPLSTGYSATWLTRKTSTELNATVTWHFRGLGDDGSGFGNNRYNADANFVYFRGDLAHTRELPAGFQAFGKIQGQISDQPLLSQEQLTGGGWGTARGYLEAEQAGDGGVFGTLELRSPSLLNRWKSLRSEWRLYVFADAGWLKIIDPLASQKNHFNFASYGVGSTVRVFDFVDGTVNAGFPQITQGETKAGDVQVTFRLGIEY
ncbi:ShlB/FhaC/HecB family hemolysin secretion/activation protein [Oleiharenicola lentus]|uniref:ShlB/FhaC/HecB family hemolysin secretion/activation protein n=1 Tax=Oleiharenicola lentus TaxID=2508720 RepID=UPI003F670A51